jgi:microcystin-dependent protein
VDTSDTDFNAAEKTGGSKTVTLTTDQIPSHNHKLGNNSGAPDLNSGNSYSHVNGSGSWNFSGAMSATNGAGGGQAHTNLQPYITCYLWRRTA